MYIPPRFTTPVVPPKIASQVLTQPYISPSEYRFAPTAVGTTNLVANSTDEPVDSVASLYERILSASDWINLTCFYATGGSFAATIVTESDYVKIKPNSNVDLICNNKFILELLGMGIGLNPATQQTLNQPGNISINDKIITISPFTTTVNNDTYPFAWPSYAGQLYITWQYIMGFPHTSLAANALAGATSITVNPTDLLQSEFVGVDQYTLPMQFRIKDNAQSETITITAVNGLICTLASPLRFAHNVPVAPDFIPVSAMPNFVSQATISLVSVLLKMRGSRATMLPTHPATRAQKVSMAEAGALSDYEVAVGTLAPYISATVAR